MRSVGVDLGAQVVWAVAADDGTVVDGRAFAADELDELARWWGHDGLDAAGACVVAGQYRAGTARAVACADHDGGSVMWLPTREGG